MFFSRRVVPPTPPSLVKFSSHVRSVTIGAGSSVPSRDQVPELRKALVPPASTDATADAVSWHAGAITGVPARAAKPSAVTSPSAVPGSTSGWSSLAGRSSDSRRPVAQVRVRASTIAVVVALVYSACRRPHSQKLSRSGMVARARAPLISPGVDRQAA